MENIILQFENKNFIEKKYLRERGVTYTPQPIALFMALNIFRIFFDEFPELDGLFETNFDYASFKQLFIKNRDLKRSFYEKINHIKVLDPCCGTGRFLITIAKILFNFNKIFESEYTDYEIKKNIIQLKH